MEDGRKNRVCAFVTVLFLISFGTSIRSCNNEYRQKEKWRREMSSRLDFEEKSVKLVDENGALKKKLMDKEKERLNENALHEATKETLAQERLINQNLKKQLEELRQPEDPGEQGSKAAPISEGKTR
ncbi:MAG: hypothetical protein KKC84_03515 [Candidatus Omnitrophica bacterium]|nr:hypothetical protein [Candidatus Omnitrophota bacterium]